MLGAAPVARPWFSTSTTLASQYSPAITFKGPLAIYLHYELGQCCMCFYALPQQQNSFGDKLHCYFVRNFYSSIIHMIKQVRVLGVDTQ